MASSNGGGGSKLESEVAMALDLSVIRYSKVFEDHRILSQALDIQPDDVVLSITRFPSRCMLTTVSTVPVIR